MRYKSLPFKKIFNPLRNAVFIDKGGAAVHHLIDHVDLGDYWLTPGNLHQSSDVTDCQANQEVHDHNGEQEDVASKK